MKQHLKKLLYRLAPQRMTAFMSARSRAHSHKVIEGWGNDRVAKLLVERFGNRVLEGPFAGLMLTSMTHVEQVGPYLLGTFESELERAWGIVFQGRYPQIIDIGAKFGYYVVGLARKYPEAAVVAFDTDWWARKATEEMAAANGVKNVSVLGYCTPQWLRQNVKDGAFIISDCEGFEGTLFDAAVIPALRSATLIIETHDNFVPGVCARLQEGFAATHDIRIFDDSCGRRQPGQSLDFLTEAEQSLATHEVRGNQIWLLCLPRSGSNRGLSDHAALNSR